MQAGTALQAQAEKQASTAQALQHAKSDILLLQESIVTKDHIVAQLADKLSSISTEYGNLKASLAAKNNEAEFISPAELKDRVTDDNDQASYMKQVAKLKEELKLTEDRAFVEKDDLMKALTFVKENNELVLQEKERLKVENEMLKEKMETISKERNFIENGLESAKLMLHEMTSEFEKVKQEKIMSDQEVLKLTERNLNLISEVDMLKSEHSGKCQEIQCLKNEKEDAIKEREQMSFELIEIKETKQNLESELKELNHHLQNMKLQNDGIIKDNKSLVAEIEILNSQHQVQSDQISDYQSQIADYENKISEASDAVEENHSLRTQNDDLYNKINNQKDVIASLKSEADNVMCKNVHLIEQLQDVSSGEELFRHDVDLLQKDNESLEEELKSIKAMLTKSQEENNNYKETVALMNTEIETLKQELQSVSSEFERYKCKLGTGVTRDFSESDQAVKEQFFVREEASRSESTSKTFNQTPVSFSVGAWSIESTLTSAEETFLTATNVSFPENSVEEHDKETSEHLVSVVSNNLHCDFDVCSKANILPVEVDNSNSKELTDLQTENERLKKELLRLQAGCVVRSAIDLAQASLVSNAEQSHLYGSAETTDDLSKIPVDLTLSSEMHPDDTAYNTYDTEGLQQGDLQEILLLREQLSHLQGDYEKVSSVLCEKTDECELLKTKLDHENTRTGIINRESENNERPDMLGQNGITASTEDRGAHYLAAPEVSDLHRIDASGMEVNLHASSALQKTRGFGSVVNSFLETVDEHVFQNSDASCQACTDCNVFDGTDIQEVEKLNRKIVEHIKEKNDLVAILDKERKKLSFAVNERQELEELCKKYLKDFENQVVVIDTMKDTNHHLQESNTELKNKIQDLNYENEKLDWHRNELELKLSNAEGEISGIKLEKINSEMKEEQVREELNRVKERLDYLETSELDIFEMREVVDSIQIEKEEILRENEKLQEVLSVKVNETEEHFGNIESLHQENLELLGEIRLSKDENSKLTSKLEAISSELYALKQQVTDLEKQNSHLNQEIEGLVDENLTLKTKVSTVETEMQNLSIENEKLQSYFPHLDSQEEQLLTMKDKCSDLENHIQEVTLSNEKMVAEVTDLEKKLLTVSDENDLLLDKCDELANIVSDLDNEKTDLLLKIDIINRNLDDVCEENNVTLQKKETEIEALIEENSTLKTQVNNLKEDIKETTEEMKLTSENLHTKQFVEITEKKNIELESENLEYQKKINTLEKDLLELVEQVQLYDDTVSEKADLASRLEQEINSLLEENSTLKTKNNILEHDIFEITEKQNELKEQLKVYQSEVSPLQSLSGVNENLTAQLELEIRLKAKLQKDIEVLMLQNAENLSERTHTEAEVERLRKELNLSENTKVENEKYAESLEKEKEKMMSENAVLKDKILLLENDHCKTLKQTECLTAELETCQLHLQAVSDNRNHVRSQIEILAAEVETLSCKRDITESRYFALETENNKIKGENEKYKKLVTNIKGKLEKLDNIIIMNSELASKNESLCKRVEEMEVHVENVKKEKFELEKLLEELTNMLHDMQTKYEEVKSEMESTKKKCDKEIKQLQTQLQTMNDDVQELRNMLDIMENEMYDATEEKLVLKENLQIQQEQYEEAVERKQKLEELLSEKHQKDAQNKRTVCESLTNRADDVDSTKGAVSKASDVKICNLCQNEFKRSSVSTFTQTDLFLNDTYLEHKPSTNQMNICDESLSQNNVASALHETEFSYLDSDKDEDTKDDSYLKGASMSTDAKACQTDHKMLQAIVLSDFQCQVNLLSKQCQSRFVKTNVQIYSYIPSADTSYCFSKLDTENTDEQSGNSFECSLLGSPSEIIQGDHNNIIEMQEVKSSLNQALIHNIPVINIASQMVRAENEQSISFRDSRQYEDGLKGHNSSRDQCINDSLKTQTVFESIQETMDIGIQTENGEKGLELDAEESSNVIHKTDMSVSFVDSGIFSAVVGAKFDFDSTNIQLPLEQLKTNVCDNQNIQNTQHKLLTRLYCCSATQTESYTEVECPDKFCQTDSMECDEIEYAKKELEEKFEKRCEELETEIEQKLNNRLDFREQKVKLQEENYDKKVKQMEYDMEEKYEYKFRMREAELEIKAEFDRKTYEKQLDDMASQKIEKIRMEKDQQFVETMQKVRSDLKRRHKAEIAKLKEELGTVCGVGPDGDGKPEGREQNIIHKLNEENKVGYIYFLCHLFRNMITIFGI